MISPFNKHSTEFAALTKQHLEKLVSSRDPDKFLKSKFRDETKVPRLSSEAKFSNRGKEILRFVSNIQKKQVDPDSLIERRQDREKLPIDSLCCT
jgi:hypothetical protein